MIIIYVIEKKRHPLNVSIRQICVVFLIIPWNLDLLCLHSAVRGGILRKGFVDVGVTLNINMSSPKAPPRGSSPTTKPLNSVKEFGSWQTLQRLWWDTIASFPRQGLLSFFFLSKQILANFFPSGSQANNLVLIVASGIYSNKTFFFFSTKKDHLFLTCTSTDLLLCSFHT